MDFLLSASLARYEMLFLLINAGLLSIHILSWLGEWTARAVQFFFGKPLPVPTPQAVAEAQKEGEESWKEEESTPKKSIKNKEEVVKNEESVSTLITPDERQQVVEIMKIAKTKIARSEYSEARSKIVEGLAIDKFDKELNCLLASIYEREKDYKKAEFVYKDLILVHDTDPELYSKLGFSLSMQGKYEIAYEIYRKLLSISDGNNDEAAEMLANLAHHLEHHVEACEYAKLYLKNHPRNADMLHVLVLSLIATDKKQEALEMIEKLRVIDPYNSKVRDLAEKLRIELELAGNFRVTDTDSETTQQP